MYRITPIVSLVSSFSPHHQQISANNKQSMFGHPHLDYDAETIINSMTNLESWRAFLIQKLVMDIKADHGIDNLNQMFDCFWVFATNNDANSLINWAQPGTYNCTIVGSTGTAATTVRFTPDSGWRNNAAEAGTPTSYINTNYNPYGVSGLNFGNPQGATTSNLSGSFGVYMTKTSLGLPTTAIQMGGVTASGGSPISMTVHSENITPRSSILSTSRVVLQTSAGLGMFQSHGGMHSMRRINDRMTDFIYNGNIIKTEYSASTVAVSQDAGNVYITCGNVNGVANLSSIKEIAFAWIGSANIDHAALYRRMNEYLIQVGLYIT